MLRNIISLQSLFTRGSCTFSEIIENASRGICRGNFQYNNLRTSIPLFRELHLSGPQRKGEDRREMLASMPARDEGTDGEKGISIDAVKRYNSDQYSFMGSIKFVSLSTDTLDLYTENCCSREDLFPDENTPTRLFNGIRFCDVPICNIRASKNNTIISLTTARGKNFLLKI
ncbi:hypothetical protein C0J52_09897 [Blattella germanica]|nr:hypothetical protein C0J52_09897 [Blattella germanica]